MAKSRAAIALVAVLVVIIAVFALYIGVTYPRTIVTVPVAFVVGGEATSTAFEQPTLNNKVQVQVLVENGVALWQARILNDDEVVWEHAAGQGEQQSYNSGWVELPSGQYNFTFGVIGGQLDAVVTLTSKGGFW